MTTRLWVPAAFVLVATLSPVFLSARSAAAKQEGSAQSSQATDERGEQIFSENCSRCHTPPMSISPRVTGTVLMHMRMRARLSRDQEKELLRYMAPRQ